MPDLRRPARWSQSVVVRVLRRPLAWWTLVAILALATAWYVSTLGSQARQTLADYGRTVPALVATQTIPGGSAITGDVAEVQLRPVGTLPDDVLATLPAGGVARTTVYAGEPIVAPRVRDGPGAGMAGVALAVGPATPDLAPGDLVDVIVTVDPLFAADASSGVVASGAEVVEVTDDRITVAVPRSRAAEVVQALAAGVAAVAVVAP